MSENMFQKKQIDIDQLARTMDTWSFAISLTFILIFNVGYWISTSISDPDLN